MLVTVRRAVEDAIDEAGADAGTAERRAGNAGAG
jgi:hypothetical protein